MTPVCAAVDRYIENCIASAGENEALRFRNGADNFRVPSKGSCRQPSPRCLCYRGRTNQGSRENRKTNCELPDECNSIRHQNEPSAVREFDTPWPASTFSCQGGRVIQITSF